MLSSGVFRNPAIPLFVHGTLPTYPWPAGTCMAYVRAVGSWFTAGLTGAKYFCVTCLYTSTDNATTLSVQSLYTTPRGSF
ncbi:BZIP-type transcription factor MBZ1 [Fusarium oxysporum f. sp. albedinis]|nr:BZIP-type transcription factor MBZ1 [Fusarium oxysporum f. sp. albedinis]